MRSCYKASVDAEEGRHEDQKVEIRREDFLLKQRREGLPSSAAPGGSWLVVHAPGGFLGQSCPARAHGSEKNPIPGETSRARSGEAGEAHRPLACQDGMTMGKSLGNALEPKDLVDRFGADAVRYFFLREVEFGNDGTIQQDALLIQSMHILLTQLGICLIVHWGS